MIRSKGAEAVQSKIQIADRWGSAILLK
jgi:hypothetical protein